jgi:hypothetical protein
MSRKFQIESRIFIIDNKGLTTSYLKLISKFIGLKRGLNIERPQNLPLSQ